MGEIDDEALLPLSELAKRLPAVRGSKSPSRVTLYRWATVGLKSRSGTRYRLETQFVGGTLCASVADVTRLGRYLDDVERPQPGFRDKREEQEMVNRAEAARVKLRAMGVLKTPHEYAQAV